MTNNINTFEELENEVKKISNKKKAFWVEKLRELFFLNVSECHEVIYIAKSKDPQKIYNVIKTIKQCEE